MKNFLYSLGLESHAYFSNNNIKKCDLTKSKLFTCYNCFYSLFQPRKAHQSQRQEQEIYQSRGDRGANEKRGKRKKMESKEISSLLHVFKLPLCYFNHAVVFSIFIFVGGAG
jgi:hypothetical protein